MAYADRDTTGSRVTAIVVVSVLVALFGWAFVTGLAVDFGKKIAEKLNAFDVAPPPPPPPPDKPPPPPPDQPNLPPPPTVPTAFPPPVPTTTNFATPPAPPAPMTPAPPAPPAPVAAPPAPVPPPPPSLAVKGSPKGSPSSWFTNDDYPADARRAQAAGRVAVMLSVDASGRVADCRVTASSGNASLDAQTCNLAKRRGRFNPAKDSAGNAMGFSFPLSTRWQLEDQ